MEWLVQFLGSTEFWVGLSLIAAVLPGPQTRIFPAIFRALARVVAEVKRDRCGR